MALWVFSTFDKTCPDSSVPLKNKFNWVFKFWKSKKWLEVLFFFASYWFKVVLFVILMRPHLFSSLDWRGYSHASFHVFRSRLVEKRNLVLVSKATTFLTNYDNVKSIFQRIKRSISKLCGFGEYIASRLVKIAWVSIHSHPPHSEL